MTIPSRGFCLASSSALCLSWSQEWTFSGRQEGDGGVQRKTVKSGSPSSAQQVRDILHSKPCCAFCPITPVCLRPREWEISGLRTSSCNQRWRYKIMDPWGCLMHVQQTMKRKKLQPTGKVLAGDIFTYLEVLTCDSWFSQLHKGANSHALLPPPICPECSAFFYLS